jgi:hypothetical protein
LTQLRTKSSNADFVKLFGIHGAGSRLCITSHKREYITPFTRRDVVNFSSGAYTFQMDGERYRVLAFQKTV